MAEYDTISKHLIQTYPADFVRFTLDEPMSKSAQSSTPRFLWLKRA